MIARPIAERRYWDKAALTSDNLREEYICDKLISDIQCMDAVFPHLVPAGVTLDLGCGIGRLTTDAGTDISEEMLARAYKGPDYRLTDGRTIPWEDESFDNVFSLFLFQHLPAEGKQAYIAEVYRVLKRGGRFRVQYVTFAERAEFSHPTDMVAPWLRDAGFTVLEREAGLIYPEWTFITAEKPK